MLGRELEREKRILERTYHDRMDVYRSRMVKDPESGETVFEEALVYGNRRCALVIRADTPAQGTVVDDVEEEHTIFADPDLQMEQNDRVVVRAESGQAYEGRSGRTYVVRNHGETGFRIDGKA